MNNIIFAASEIEPAVRARTSFNDIILVIVAGIIIYFIVRLVRTTGKNTPVKDSRFEYAHRVLLEVDATDKVANILPLDLKYTVQTYLEKSKEWTPKEKAI